MKQIHMNIPFIEALKQMPFYAKFMKEFVSNRRNLVDAGCTHVNKNVSQLVKY